MNRYEEAVELWVSRRMDALDEALLEGELTQEEYDEHVRELDRTAERRLAGERKCAICGGRYAGHGNNPAPVAEGRCCDVCNDIAVIPARIARAYGRAL
jgi:hypothetical protein